MNWNYFYAIPTRLEFGWILTAILSLHCYLWEIQSISLFWSTVHLLGGRGLVKMSDSLFFCINMFNVSNFTHDTWMKNLKVNREVLFPFPFPVISFQINATVLSSNVHHIILWLFVWIGKHFCSRFVSWCMIEMI